MRRGFSSSYIFIPLAYIGIIFILLFLQFSGGNLFRSDFGPLSFSASFEMGKDNKTKLPSSIQLKYSGLGFSFDNSRGLQLQNQDDSVRNLKLVGYDALSNGFRVKFEEKITVDFTTVIDGLGQLAVDVNLPQSILPLKNIKLPYAFTDGAQADLKAGSGSAQISWQGKDYNFALPNRSFFDQKAAFIIIPGDSSQKALRYAEKAKTTGSDLDSLLASASSLISEKEFDDSVQSFISNAYNGWKGARYNAGSGSWTTKDRGAQFNENLMTALLAEAWERNDYARVFAEMRNASDIHADQISYKSAVFLGNLKRTTNEMVANDIRKTGKLLNLLSNNDASILLEDNLALFVADRGSEALRTALKTYLSSLDISTLNVSQFIGLMRLCYLDPNPDDSLASITTRFKESATKIFAANITKNDTGIYFTTSPNIVDSYTAMVAGRVLIAMGQKEGDSRFSSLGKIIMHTMLSQADDQGFISQSFEIAGSSLNPSSSFRGPEDFYLLCSNNPSYPREISYFKELKPGMYLYTIMKIESSVLKPGELEWNVSYPRSKTQFLIFGGMPNIDPTTGMYLFGIKGWRNASDFEIYSKGRFYNPDTKVLMVKYFDDSSSESIRVWYNP